MSVGSMAWVFDDPERFVTMSACNATVYSPDMNNNNGRWNVSNIHWYWRNASWWYARQSIKWTAHGIADRPRRYVYPIGAFSSPEWWAGQPDNPQGFVSMFNLIPAEVLLDVRRGRALLLIDNLNEGFHLPWLWQFFHQQCEQLSLPLRSIVWLNSNELEAKTYQHWADAQGIESKLNVIPFCHLMYQQKVAFSLTNAPTWDEHLATKRRGDIKLYNCLNRIQRPHREYLLLRLIQENLLQYGLVSHDNLCFDMPEDITPNTISRAMRVLPAVIDDGDFMNNKAMTINQEIYLRTWLSIITETHAADDENQVFISEKVWKPIFCRHPFLVLGNKRSIAMLQDKGYDCTRFGQDGWDSAPFNQRVEGILNAIRSLRRESDLLRWYDGLRDSCEHNHEVFMRQDFFDSPACDAILRLYNDLL